MLQAYWTLWFAQRNADLQRSALEVAQRELAEAEIRRDAGALAPAELVPIRVEVARAEEAVVSTRADVRASSIALAELLGVAPGTILVTDSEPPVAGDVPPPDVLVNEAISHSPALARLKAGIAAAEIQADVARDAALPRLDATGSLRVAGLGDGVGNSFAELVTFDAIVAFASLRLELPVTNRARRLDAERAEIAVSTAQAELELAGHELRATVAALDADLDTAHERLDLARQTAALARENVEAQTARFDAGKSTTLEVVSSLESQREAELRVLQIEVEIARQRLAMENLIGALGRRAARQ